MNEISSEKNEDDETEEKHDNDAKSEEIYFCLYLISGHNKISLAFPDKTVLLVTKPYCW